MRTISVIVLSAALLAVRVFAVAYSDGVSITRTVPSGG